MRQLALSFRAISLSIAAAVVVADQISKVWATRALDEGPIIVIDGFLRFVLHFNPGAAFSSFQNSGVAIAVVGFVIVGVLIVALGTIERRYDAVALGIVLGGAMGNLIDRVVRGEGNFDGKVVDFIDLWRIPTFNVADAAINIGIVVILLGAFRREE